jgi:hypothetical protein
MNKRVKELAEQATTEESDGFKYFDKEKFAELIIAECGEAFWTEECFVSDLAIEYYNRQVGKIRRRFE